MPRRALCLVLLAACAHLPAPIEKPTAEVRSVEVGQAVTGIRGEVAFDVFNPNPIGVPLQQVDWQLWIGDQSRATGLIEIGQTIPARASAPVRALIYVDAGAAASAAAQIALGERRYRITGALRFSTRLGAISVPFDARGTLGG